MTMKVVSTFFTQNTCDANPAFGETNALIQVLALQNPILLYF